jgi:CRISPR system Cascade subunit CasB
MMMSENKTPKLFEIGHPATEYILEWWKNLAHNKGDSAEIRRCKSLSEIELTSAYQRFYWGFLKTFKTDEWKASQEKTALFIALIVYIKEDKRSYQNDKNETAFDYFAYQISQGEKPKLSELRFRRLLKITDNEKLFRFLIQVIRLLDRKVNLLDLIKITYYWNDETRKYLAYKYYEKANLT